MKNRITMLATTLALAAAGLAAEGYHCPLIVTDPGTAPRIDRSQYVDLTIDGAAVKPIIHITDATKDLTFKTCAPLAKDGSNFADWFSIECRTMAGADGRSYMVDVYLIGAYAGISPPIDESYSMYRPIADVAAKLDLAVPRRTVAIYADSNPQFEFFCYPPE